MLANRLKSGDRIGIVAPSKCLNDKHKQFLENFKEKLKEFDIEVVYSKNLFAIDKYKIGAGTPEQRAEDINSMFRDKSINAIWCFQGGTLANQILDLIDFEAIKENPKLFLGKSDIDMLLLTINKFTGLITIHCCDPKLGDEREFDYEYTQNAFKERLFNLNKEIKPYQEWNCIREGKATGKIMGCNLTTILKIAGTKYFPDFDGAILFLESLKANAAKMICQLTQLKEMGVFDKIKGIVIGHIHEFDNCDGDSTPEEIINDITKGYDFPILKIEEFGHYYPHTFVPIGAKAELNATNKKLKIIEEFLN